MSDRPSEAVLWDFLRGAMMTKALALVADLGVANALAAGPRRVADLAQEQGADPDALQRVLRALASDGVFEEREPGVFAHTTASELLRSDAPDSWPPFAHLFGDVFYGAVGGLGDAVRSGSSTFADMFGSDFWSWLAEHPDERSQFDEAMAGGKEGQAERLAALEWEDGDVVVDVGGGNGALLLELLRRRPGLRGIVFDLPETERDEASLGASIEFVAGSFFDRVPSGDAYVLSAILHDWDDEHATAILRTIRAAATSDARLLIIESVIPPGNEPNGAKWLDLLMLVLAGGRERDEAQWRMLVDAAGFRVEQIEDGFIQARCR
jgi:hypothetical protein